MLVSGSRLIGTPILSMQAAGPIATVAAAIIDPNNLKILGLKLSGPLVAHSNENLIDVKSIREYSRYGCIIDSADELIAEDDVIKIKNVLELNFDLIGLKVETKQGTKLGRVSDYTLTSEDFMVQQIIVRRPALKALVDPELTISRKEIVEVTDYKIIVKDEEKVIKEKAENDFIPNFINPFRKNGKFAEAERKETEKEA